MSEQERSNRVHKDPYGNYRRILIASGNEAILQLGGTPLPIPDDDGSYEPGQAEKDLCRVTLEVARELFGDDVLRAALVSAGIPDGIAIPDDWDVQLYQEVLEYIRRNIGEGAESQVLGRIEER